MSTEIAHSFNSVHPEITPAQRPVNDEWHFDLRYIQLEPNPSHVIAVVHPESLFFHVERLPIVSPRENGGISFFPESPEEAAPEVAKALLHAYTHNFNKHQRGDVNGLPNVAQWRLTTDDEGLASAVGDEFRRLGVNPPELCSIGVSTKSVNRIMQDCFDGYFRDTMKAVGIPEEAFPHITKPTSIAFHEQRPVAISDINAEESQTDPRQTLLSYVSQIERSRPQQSMVDDLSERLFKGTEGLSTVLTKTPTNVVKEAADAGDSEAAYDYGMRLLLGYGSICDRTLARKYMINSLSSPQASDELKCMVHSTLLEWYISEQYVGAPNRELFSRYLFAASHHANIAASLARQVSPPGVPTTFPVLQFIPNIFRPCIEGKPELLYFFRDAWQAWKDWQTELEVERAKQFEKVSKNQMRYLCATPGCGIEADKGKMLSQCAGKCDKDKRPSYCSKQCQKADWKNHKPFCRPGAPSSVMNAVFYCSTDSPASSSDGALHIPVTLPNGMTVLVTSDDNDPKTLKELRAHLLTHLDCPMSKYLF